MAQHTPGPDESDARLDSLGVDDWINDLIASAEWERGPDDMRDYFRARIAATQEMLGIGGDAPSPLDGGSSRAFLIVIEATPGVQASPISPFDGFMEAPMEFGSFFSPQREGFSRLRAARERLLRKSIRAGVEHYFPEAMHARVSLEQLEQRGVPRQPPRDYLDVDLDDW